MLPLHARAHPRHAPRYEAFPPRPCANPPVIARDEAISTLAERSYKPHCTIHLNYVVKSKAALQVRPANREIASSLAMTRFFTPLSYSQPVS